MKDKEKELLDSGMWKKETLCLHIQEIDETAPKGVRRLSYDMGNTFTGEQISSIECFAREVNRRFPNIKMFTEGAGLIPTGNGESAEQTKKAEHPSLSTCSTWFANDNATYK